MARSADQAYAEAERRIGNARRSRADELALGALGLSSLPDSLGSVPGLVRLRLQGNRLSSLPDWLGNLTSLTGLYLSGNQLTSLPASLGNLTKLTVLSLDHNLLTSLPDTFGDLSELGELHLFKNSLTSLPSSLGGLFNLTAVFLGANPLESPPSEVVNQGTEAVLQFLRERRKKGRRQWVSKLILVGEGGVGKTQLLRSLKGEEFAGTLGTTHGIEVRQLELAHPTETNVRMSLNCWDFAGQEIYHATHQFFLTQRSLFVLVWNARIGWEQSKLYYWLDAIKARAPDAPVVIAATWTDERDADLALAEIMRAYPQVRGHFAVSNKTRAGIEDLRAELARVAAKLPLMGEEWPASWLSAAERVRRSEERHVTPQELCAVFTRSGVARETHAVLGRILHDLGDLLWYQNDAELNDLVILKPLWVTAYISKVLESSDVIGKDGIFTRPHMDQLWSDLKPEMRDHFLRLMERFDLSYRTLDPQNREISLVVELLPLDPAAYESEWQKPLAQQCCSTITMRYRMNTVPAGIPTWFIARSHRFTTHTHWRSGALFADGKERRHLALVRCNKHKRVVELSARGPMPHNFFALLRDGFELTLARFPGLDVTRYMPCPGHDGLPCDHEFKHADLERRLLRVPVKGSIECPVAVQDVSVPELVFGLSWPATGTTVLERMDELQKQVVARIDARADTLLSKLDELQTLAQRQFLTVFEAVQKDPDACCPNVFTLTGQGRKWQLRFLCQAPGRWHGVSDAGCYDVEVEPVLLRTLRPYASGLLTILKTAATLFKPAMGIMFRQYAPLLPNELALMAASIEAIPIIGPELQESELIRGIGPHDGAGSEGNAAVIRTVRRLLDLLDPDRERLGLKLVPTPEGHLLWLCEHHAQEYGPRPTLGR